jgi:tetratricopeptide (TPR) repeat protein
MNRVTATLLLLLFAAAASLRAEQPSPRDLYPQATAAAMADDVDAAGKKTGQLVDLGKSYGIKTFPVYAESAAALARQAARDKNKPVAEWAASAANTLDSGSPAVAFNMADSAAAQHNWGAAARWLGTGFTNLFSRYRWRLLTRTDTTLTLCIALLLSAAVFAIVLFVRYGRSAAHDFREILSGRFRGGSVTVLAVALLFLPIFFWLGPLWIVFYWFVIFFGYAGLKERVAIVVLSLLVAAVPVVIDWTADRIAGVDSPVVAAAISSTEQNYQPETLRRLQDLSNLVGDNSRIALLLGNLQVQEGNESQAAISYRRSVEIADSAGAHVNIGNLHFLNNDFGAAITKYEEAEKLDPKLAIAFYNHSVASGETYKYDAQAQQLEMAKAIDRAMVERLLSNPPPQKVVWYHPPIADAWRIAEAIARKGSARELYGNYAFFDLQTSILNPVTLGALLAAILSVVLWLRRRKSGYANACIKCGRTFCYRCKSSRESATYCTQCIHIYLKRDGVSLDTKRQKLEEVQQHQGGATLRNRLFTTIVPGSGQLLEGRTLLGLLGLFLFFFFVVLAIVIGRLAPVLSPGATVQLLLRGGAVLLAAVVWLSFSLPVYRRKVVSG